MSLHVAPCLRYMRGMTATDADITDSNDPVLCEARMHVVMPNAPIAAVVHSLQNPRAQYARFSFVSNRAPLD